MGWVARFACRAGGRAAVLLAAVVALGGSAAQATPLSYLMRARIEELKTRGLLPLWSGVDLPMHPAELNRILQHLEATSLAPADRELLSGVRQLLSPSLWVSSPYGPLSLSVAQAGVAGGSPSFGYTLAWQTGPQRSELQSASVSFSVGTVDVLVGRSPVQWGPGAYAGLALSEYAGGLDLLRVSFQPWAGVRYSKFFGRIDDRISAVAQRVDILFGPSFRLGVGDAVLMVGSPYWLYLVNPLPPLNALDVGFAIFNKEVHRTRNDNGAITLDFDWLPFRGLRFYGELLVDDVQFVWPVLISPDLEPARWGAILGFDWSDALPGWGLRFEYTVVPNWTYATVAGSTHWMARGLPLGHPLGNDFDLWHVRFTRSEPPGLEVWLSYLRKGEGRPDRFWSSAEQARGALFLTGVVEHSVILGTEIGGSSGPWTYSVGPWLAYRTNAGHLAGATRLDWGVSLAAQVRY
ncbi:MAG: capsule assembly Wzi family protein [Armatimonadota bacterium]|nr:capsule assembly Wzi family protein [Armatimonadota bacterium]